MNKNKKSPKVVISGYYGFNNFGDDAVLSVLVDSLKKSGIEDITVFSKNPKSTKEMFKVKSSKTFGVFGLIFNLMRCDFLISGGGSLLQDSTSVKSLIYYLCVIMTALFFRKKVIIFAQGLGPINNKLFEKITAMVLKKCTYITVRDEKSFFLARSWGLNPDLVSDPVWNIKLKTKYSHRGVGIQLREWPSLTPQMLKDFAKYIADVYSDKIIFIYALQAALDLEICEQLEVELLKINPDLHTHVVTNRATFEIVEAFSHLDELIAMRYHACLLGLKYGIRVLPIIYDPKVEKLADEFGLTSRLMLHGEFEAEKKIRKLRYGEYHVDEEKVSRKKFDFHKFEDILFPDGKN